MSTPPKPTEGELAILRVIWSHGPATVRAIRDVMDATGTMRYTTVLKLLQIMTGKGLVRREDEGRAHVYHARLSEERTQRQLLRDLLDRAFGGSTSQLIVQALATTRASDEELTTIRKVLARQKAKRR